MGQKCGCICNKDSDMNFSFYPDMQHSKEESFSVKAGRSSVARESGSLPLLSIIMVQSYFKAWSLRKKLPLLKAKDEKLVSYLISEFRNNSNPTARIDQLFEKFNKAVYLSELDEPNRNECIKFLDSLEKVRSNNKTYRKSILAFPEQTKMYIGDVTIDNKMHGSGTLYLKSGEVYEGSWILNSFTGWGRYISSDGSIFQGN